MSLPDFLSRTPEAQQLRKSIDKWDFIKLKIFCSAKEVGENICQQHIKGLITRMYRDLKKLNSPKINEPIKKWASGLNRTFSIEEIQKMLTISSHKGNVNQNLTKIPPHPC
jgi:hypothetical protein